MTSKRLLASILSIVMLSGMVPATIVSGAGSDLVQANQNSKVIIAQPDQVTFDEWDVKWDNAQGKWVNKRKFTGLLYLIGLFTSFVFHQVLEAIGIQGYSNHCE